MQHTIAKIERTHLGYEDHGIFSITVMFNYGGSSQGFGPIGFSEEVVKAIVDSAGPWEDLVGRTVMAIRDDGHNGLVRGIAPLPTERGEGFILGPDGKIEPYKVDQ